MNKGDSGKKSLSFCVKIKKCVIEEGQKSREEKFQLVFFCLTELFDFRCRLFLYIIV